MGSPTFQRNHATPMYQQIADYLTKLILDGVYKENEKIPTEVELMEMFDVSRTTVRQAVAQLIKKGLVEKKSGKGTFVLSHRYYHTLNEFKSLYETLSESNIAAQTELVEFNTKPAGGRIARLLGLHENETILQVGRVYYADEHPIAYGLVSVHPRYSAAVHLEEAKIHPIYQILESKFNFKVNQANLEIFADKASPDISQHLHIDVGEPVLGLERLLYTEQEEPIEHTYVFFCADAYRFRISLPGSRSHQKNRFQLLVKKEPS